MHCFISFKNNKHLTSLFIEKQNNYYNGTWVFLGLKSKIISSVLNIEKAHEWYDCFVLQLNVQFL